MPEVGQSSEFSPTDFLKPFERAVVRSSNADVEVGKTALVLQRDEVRQPLPVRRTSAIGCPAKNETTDVRHELISEAISSFERPLPASVPIVHDIRLKLQNEIDVRLNLILIIEAILAWERIVGSETEVHVIIYFPDGRTRPGLVIS